MSLIIPLSVSMFSFMIGLGLVAFIAYRRGFLKPALEILNNQQINQAELRSLELQLSERDQEIARLKARLKEFQDQVAKQAELEYSHTELEADVFELDDNPIEVAPALTEHRAKPTIDAKPILKQSRNDLFNYKPAEEKDVASLSDMNTRLQQISLLMKSLPTKFKDVLRTAVTARDDKISKLMQSIDAVSKLSTLEQSYIDSVLTNATSKSEELEIKGVILKMRSSRAAMFRVKSFVADNQMSHFHMEVVDDFQDLVMPHTPA